MKTNFRTVNGIRVYPQAETVDDLEFKDNAYTSEKEQFNGYTYPQTG